MARGSVLIVTVSSLAIALAGFGIWKWNASHTDAQQYSGQQKRLVKALSAERTEGLKAGEGLGYAKAAELNGWPGPLHVLELADKLSLTDEQRDRMEQLREEMLAEAKPLGEKMIAAEQKLEAVFSSANPDAGQVEAVTLEIASIEARLRAVHLTTHLLSAPVLSDGQKAIYKEARGYGTVQIHLGH